MARRIIENPSRTLAEFRLLTGLTDVASLPENISLHAQLVTPGADNGFERLHIPILAAAMQSVSGPKLAIELAKHGGMAFVFCSQPIENQAAMVTKIKRHKAGFVDPLCVTPEMTIDQVVEISEREGYSTFPVVDAQRHLLGILTKNDYERVRHAGMKVTERMVPREQLDVGVQVSLSEANQILIDSHRGVLPIVDESNVLQHVVFRTDVRNHETYPDELLDARKRLRAAAAMNTRDYAERAPALIEAGVDVLLFDSSDGYSTFLRDGLAWMAEHYPGFPIVGGNVISAEGFRFLAEAGAWAVKVGMGGGSICITQEQKGAGRGLATAVAECARARDAYLEETGRYVPVIADGGIVHAKDIGIALALGADSVMMGRYFARFEESPTPKVSFGDRIMKPYWGEGSQRAREWMQQRYRQSGFAEGVEGMVEYVGYLKDTLPRTLAKIRSAMSSAGCKDIRTFHQQAVLELVSALSIREGKVHDIYLPESGMQRGSYHEQKWG